MTEFWTNYGFYLWGFTTLLVLVCLGWLAWLTFAGQDNAETHAADMAHFVDIEERLNELAEATPFMQATLGRALQFYGLEQVEQAFALAVVNARGDGFLFSRTTSSEVVMLPLSNWQAQSVLTVEQNIALEKARTQRNGRT